MAHQVAGAQLGLPDRTQPFETDADYKTFTQDVLQVPSGPGGGRCIS